MLDGVFKRAAAKNVPANHLSVYSVHRLLGLFEPYGEKKSTTIGNPAEGDYATLTYDAVSDGKNMTFDLQYRKNGQEYKTELKGEMLNKGVVKVTSLVFDNHVENLKNPKEIFAVLDWISNFQADWVRRKMLPRTHEEKGEFGTIGRFLTRHMPNLGGGTSWLLKP